MNHFFIGTKEIIVAMRYAVSNVHNLYFQNKSGSPFSYFSQNIDFGRSLPWTGIHEKNKNPFTELNGFAGIETLIKSPIVRMNTPLQRKVSEDSQDFPKFGSNSNLTSLAKEKENHQTTPNGLQQENLVKGCFLPPPENFGGISVLGMTPISMVSRSKKNPLSVAVYDRKTVSFSTI